MLHIAICDDERVFVNHLKELLSQYILETGEEIKTSVFYDGLDLIEKYDPSFDLIFLDIQMKLVDGLRAAERIREKDESVGIIFLTTLAQYGLEGCSTAVSRRSLTSLSAAGTWNRNRPSSSPMTRANIR